MNQKIATKFIGKLGFQVTAAWNGKEALEWLMDSTQGINPKPDLILMDVQMPIIDGYKCTHLLRHHRPYKTLVHDVPIVAMTASAIQGDREKCTRAGMDDYLPKPVTMGILEKMLIRWCLAKRKSTSTIKYPLSTSDCSELREDCGNADIPHVEIEDEGNRTVVDTWNGPITPRPLAMNGDPEKEQSPFDSPVAPEMAPPVRRPEGEGDWSSQLRESKLIDAAGGPTNLRSKSFQGQQPAGEALTEENMDKLKRETRPPLR